MRIGGDVEKIKKAFGPKKRKTVKKLTLKKTQV